MEDPWGRSCSAACANVRRAVPNGTDNDKFIPKQRRGKWLMTFLLFQGFETAQSARTSASRVTGFSSSPLAKQRVPRSFGRKPEFP